MPSVTYRGQLAAIQIDFEIAFQQEGWRTIAIGSTSGAFYHFANEDTLEPGADVGLVAWMADRPPSEVVGEFRGHPNVADSTDPITTAIAGLPALEFDLLLTDRDEPGLQGCIQRFPLIAEPFSDAWVEEVLACTWNRIWVVNVEGLAVTIIVSAGADRLDPNSDPWQIADFEPLLDDFIDGITFCTEATACDA